MQQQRTATDWVYQEAGWHEFLAELRRLVQRNRAHPLPLLLLVLLLTGLGIYRGYTHQPPYRARIALRLTENDLGQSRPPRPVRELRAWVFDVALSDANLIAVMQRFDINPQKRRAAMDQALESMREDIEVEAWRNEFLLEDQSEVGRSARVAISYYNRDADVAWKVVEALVDAAKKEQIRARREQVALLEEGIEPAIARAREQLVDLKVRRAGIRLSLGLPMEPLPVGVSPPWAAPGGPAPALGPVFGPGGQLGKLGGGPAGSPLNSSAKGRAARELAARLMDKDDREIELLEQRIAALSREQVEAETLRRSESLNLSFQTEIIDSERPRPRDRRRLLALVGAMVGCLVALLLGGVVIKAFDRRIYTEEDLRRLGYSVCGVMPVFPGDDVGSMNSRVRMRAR